MTSLREYEKKCKRLNDIKPSINDIVITFEVNAAPKQMDAWTSCRIYKWP